MSGLNSSETRDSNVSPSVELFDIQAVVQNPSQWEQDHDYYTAYPNRWAYIRNKYLRDFASEFLGKSAHRRTYSTSALMVVLRPGTMMIIMYVFPRW